MVFKATVNCHAHAPTTENIEYIFTFRQSKINIGMEKWKWNSICSGLFIVYSISRLWFGGRCRMPSVNSIASVCGIVKSIAIRISRMLTVLDTGTSLFIIFPRLVQIWCGIIVITAFPNPRKKPNESICCLFSLCFPSQTFLQVNSLFADGWNDGFVSFTQLWRAKYVLCSVSFFLSLSVFFIHYYLCLLLRHRQAKWNN